MKKDYNVLRLWHECDGLPVGSTPHLESAADGCYANWCQINGHAALEQYRARPSFPTALPQPCPPVLGPVQQPAPSQPWSLTLPNKSVLFRTQCSMNTEHAACSSCWSSTDCAPLPCSFSLYSPKFVLWPFPPSILPPQHSFHSELHPSLSFSPVSHPPGRNEAIVVCSEGMQFELFSLGILELS